MPRSDLQSVDDDHRKLAESLGQREVEFALKRPQLERERLAAIASASAALAAYEKELAPRLAQQEKEKAAKTAKLEADLKAYEATVLPKKVAEWEKGKSPAVRWMTLEPTSLKASGGATLTHQPDGSILAAGKNAVPVNLHDHGRDRPDRHHRRSARGLAPRRPAQPGPRTRARR